MYTREDAMLPEICNHCDNELVMELSLVCGVCSHCREMVYPSHLHKDQWDMYWKHYVEKNER